MAKVEVIHEGHVVQDVVIGITQPTTPAGALPPDIGWVQISTSDDRGSIWDTGSGPPTQDAGQAGDMYLDVDTGDVYRWDGTEWILQGTFAPGTDTPEEILAKLITVDGEGSELDADTLDGHDSTYFATDADMNTAQGDITALQLRADNADTVNFNQDADISAIEADNDAQDIAIAGKANAVHTHPQSDITNLVADLALKAPLASPTFTGDPKAPTPATADNDTSIATTAYVKANISAVAQFPEAPNDGLTYGRKNLAWATIVGGAVVSDTAPGAPLQNGQLWYETDTGNTYVWVTDADSSQWVQQNVMPSGGASDNLSTAADMSIGFRTSGNRFVVNDKADLTGTDVMTVSEAGALTTTLSLNAGGSITTANGIVSGATSAIILGNGSGAGIVYLRPNGVGSNTGQTTIDSTGNMTVAGYISGLQDFASTNAAAVLATGSAGTIYLRPNGRGSATGQTTIDNAGAMTTAGTLSAVAPYTTNGSATGISLLLGSVRSSQNISTVVSHHIFYNPNGTVGSISTNGSATTFSTSSDERLKNVGADYDPVEAIAIIRADPVKNFQWKASNIDAIGWIAQRSHAVHEDLATHVAPREAGEKGEAPEEEFWGIDYGRRTPYLWAALTHALDRIDQLEARLAALEGGA